MIVQCVTSAVTQAVTIIAEKFVDDMKTLNNSTVSNMKNQMKQESYQLDRMEHYTRRDNIRIKGISYADNENTNEIVMKLASDMGRSYPKTTSVQVTDSELLETTQNRAPS